MKEVSIESIRVSLVNYQRVVILKEKETERFLPIWIGPAEADAIAVRLQDVSVARPLTHDLLRNMIDTLGANVRFVVVNDLNNDTFYARIVIDQNGSDVEVDSRPSDAIALAVRASVPIYVEETVLERAGVTLDGDSEGGEPGALENQRPMTEEEIKGMSAFKDFIESLDLDDFDKRKP